jgi:hypothetical protein
MWVCCTTPATAALRVATSVSYFAPNEAGFWFSRRGCHAAVVRMERFRTCQVEKSAKEIAAEMEKLALVRARREAQHKKMLEEHGYDIYRDKAPPPTSNAPKDH